MDAINETHGRITPAQLMIVKEWELDLVNEISGFLESTPASDGCAVCLILRRGAYEIRADFHPHIHTTSELPTNLIVVIGPSQNGIAAHLHYGAGVILATLSHESIQKTLFPNVH